MAGRFAVVLAFVGWASAFASASAGTAQGPSQATAPAAIVPADLFTPADTCMVCHNDLTAPNGEDVSIGADWRASMMANSARDPYWQAAVRRELMDFPKAAEAIEDECSICHMPMTTFTARAAGGKGRILAHLPLGRVDDPDAAFASDGVACSVCHQIQPSNLGSPSSFRSIQSARAAKPSGASRRAAPGRSRARSAARGRP